MGNWKALLAICLLTVLAAVRPTFGEALCVVCQSPPATYRCQARSAPDGHDLPASAGQLLCIKELAKTGGHQSCSVERAATSECEGDVVSVYPPADASYANAPGPSRAVNPRLNPPAPADYIPPYDPKKASGDEPATVEELAQETAKSSKKGLKKVGDAVSNTGKVVVDTAKKTGDTIGDAAKSAGSTVGGAAKKTWKCLTSLFSDC